MARLSRLGGYGLVSSALTIIALVNAFTQRANFYAATVYLAKSSGSMMILWNQAIWQTVVFGKMMQAIFFGQLRLIELERLQERGWFAATETLLALTIFKDDFESTFVALCVGLLFIKVFHWLASDRVEMMEQSPNISTKFHLRMVSLLGLLWVIDCGLLLFAVESILVEGPTVMIMFASEYLILLAMVWSTSMRYMINLIDLRRDPNNPWEAKSIYLFYIDLAADFFKLVTYSIFFFLILTFYGLPLNILRDVYVTLRSFMIKMRDLRRFRRATADMDTKYPDATKEEVERGDATCIICREEMEWKEKEERAKQVGLNETPKKLGCGHIFHFHCLKSWLERQQSCPTCRRPVLPDEDIPAGPTPALAPARPPQLGQPANPAQPQPPGVPAADPVLEAQQNAMRQARFNLARNLGRPAFEAIFPGEEFPEEALQPTSAGRPRPQPPAAPTPTPTPTTSAARPRHLNEAERMNRPFAVSPNVDDDDQDPPEYPTLNPPDASSPSQLPPTLPSRPKPTGNPLATFALKGYPLPKAGEAALYARPPAAGGAGNAEASATEARRGGEYANVAFGAYTKRIGTPKPGTGPTNMEEKIEFVKHKFAETDKAMADYQAAREAVQRAEQAPAAGTGVGAAEAGAAEAPAEGTAAAGVQVIVGSSEALGLAGEAADPSGEVGVSAREAARAAAERRANAATSRGSLSTAEDTSAISPRVDQATTPDAAPATADTALPSTAPPAPPAPPTAIPRPPPNAYPRLIPLFSSSDSTTIADLAKEYPTLLSHLPPLLPLNPYSAVLPQTLPSRPLLPSKRAGEELEEADRLTRRMVEERLRVVRGFQEKLEGLGRELQGALGGTEGEGRREEKGKGKEV